MTTERAPTDEAVAAATRQMTVAASPTMKAMTDRVNTEVAERRAETNEMVKMLQGLGPAWIKDATPAEMQAFCGLAVALGLSPVGGDCYLIHGVFYPSIQGRRSMAVRSGERRSESEPRMLSVAEETLHGAEPEDVARIVEVWRRGEGAPHLGVGIVRASEIEAAKKGKEGKSAKGRDGVYYLPLAKDPPFMAAKRAAMAAYRKAFPELSFGGNAARDIEVTDLGSVDAESDGPRAIKPEDLLASPAESSPAVDSSDTAAPAVVDEATAAALANIAPAQSVEPDEVQQPGEEPMALPVAVTRVVAEIVWGEWDADKEYPIATVLGMRGDDWLEYGFTVNDAAEVAAAVQGIMGTYPDRTLAEAASEAHSTRRDAGLPYTDNAIITEDDR